MATLLHIDASPRAGYSVSRKLSAAFVEAWKAKNPDGHVTRRDLAEERITFVDFDWITGAFSSPDQHQESHKKALALSDVLVAELLAADEVVIGTPMYNLNVPAVLKAWIDHVVRAGKTFRMSAAGPEGLVVGKKVHIGVASGSVFDPGSPFEAYNFEVPYLRAILGFIGMTDITFVHAGGTNEVASGKVPVEVFLQPFLARAEQSV